MSTLSVAVIPATSTNKTNPQPPNPLMLSYPFPRFTLGLLLLTLLLASAPRVSAIAINGAPTLPDDITLQLESSVNYRVEVIGNGADVPGPNTYQYNVWVSGRDIYGNAVFIQVDQGTVSVSGEIPNPGGTPTAATVAPITGTWTVPNDGTLHNTTTGYRLFVAVYALGAPLPDTAAGLTGNLAVPLQTSGLLKIEVPPDIEIAGIAPIFKQPATATASVAGGALSLALASPGSGYDANFPPAITVAAPPPGGTPAEFAAIVEADTGSITGFTTLNPGAGYVIPPTVAIAPPPSYMTQRTGGILYQAGTYYGGDIVRFKATVRNRATVAGRQGRPLRSTAADRHRLNLVLTTDPEYDERATPPDDEPDEEADANPDPTPTPAPTPPPTTTDDFLVAFHDIRGDMAGAPAGTFSTIRAVNVYRTPGALPAYGIATGGTLATATAALPVGGVLSTADLNIVNAGTGYDRATPPAVTITGGGGFGATAVATVGLAGTPQAGTIIALTIINGGAGYATAPTVTIAPPRIGARNYTPTPDNGFLDIGEQVQIDFEVLMPKNFAGIYYVAARADSLNNGNFLPVNPLARKTWVSAVEARIRLLSGPDALTGIVSQVTAPDGTGLLQSNGASDGSVIDGSGRYAAFQSLANNLAVNQSQAAAAAGSGGPTLAQPSGPNTVQQIYRRDLSTREILLASASSGGAPGNGVSQNPSINRNPLDLAVDGRFIAFESQANNLVSSDINQASDIFIRSYNAGFRTSLVSINQDGIQGNAGSFRPSLSSTGRFVAFESTATNLDLVNPVPNVSNLGSQIYVHDRDVANTGTFDSPGNVRTYLVSMANDGSTRATASVAGIQIINGQVSAVTVTSGGSNYPAAYPPTVVIAPPPAVPGASQATAQAVVDGATGAVTGIRIVNPGAGYNPAAPPAVTIAPRGLPAGDALGNNGWNNQPRISDDGQYVTWVSYSSNLPRTPGGAAIGNAGWRGVVYRIRLQDGIPLTSTIEAVSVSNAGQVANMLAYEPSINADGSVIAFSSWASNLVPNDTNGAVDVFARDFRPGINATRRVSESQPRLAIGSIFFITGRLPGLAPDNNPAIGDIITLNDGTNPPVNFTFGPAGVPIGATASATRDNLVRAINNAFRGGLLNIVAGNVPSNRLRSVNTGNNETILNATDLLNVAEPTPNTPANVDYFYSTAFAPPGQALLPGLLLLHTNPDAPAPNQPIVIQSGGAPAPVRAFDGVNTLYTMASGYSLRTSGMRIGGRQAELDSGEFDGVPLGSYQPSIDQSGDVVAFKSTMASLDVFDRTFTDTNGIFRGELLRALYNAAGNIYVADRDPATGITRTSTRVSVSRFGYRTNRLLNTPSSAASHSPAVSGNGRYVTFSSDSDNRGGLIFGSTNLLPQDTNELRDIFLHDRLIATDLPDPLTNRQPQAVLTEPLWLSGQTIGVGSVITAAVLATDPDEALTFDNVRFLIDGQEFEPTGRYGNFFTFSYIALRETAASSIQARVIDRSGALNDTALSQEIRFVVGPASVGPTAVTAQPPVFIIDPVSNPSGIPSVGFPITLSARVTIPFIAPPGSAVDLFSVLNVVRFYANGVLIGEATVPSGVSGALVGIDWFPQSSGAVEITAVASTQLTQRFTTSSGTPSLLTSSMTLASNTLPTFFVTDSATGSVPGSPAFVAAQIFQKVMSRAPSAAEQTYYTDQLTSGATTPAQMVAELVTTQEYTDLQNRLFNFYYRLGTQPLEYTYPALLNSVRSNRTPLPATVVEAAVNNPPTPYGSTEGQAAAAQQIVSSAGFNAAFPGISSFSNQNFVTWFRGRMALFGGSNHSWTDTPVWQTLMPASPAPQGAAVAFMTAYYTAKNNGGAYGPTSAYQYQLYATSLRWLFTNNWAPAVRATATATVADGRVTALTPVNTGSGYLAGYTPTAVTFSGGGGSGAAATALIDPTGAVTGFVISNQGTGYTSAPSVTIAAPDVTTQAQLNNFIARLTASSEGETTWSYIFSYPELSVGNQILSKVRVMTGGTGYTSPPTVTITGGGGTGATATAVVVGGVVTEFIITNPGTGYTSTPTVTLTGGGGSGATARAEILDKRSAMASPANDGINNLLKYAFNMNPTIAGGQLPAGGTSGTPRGDIVTVNGLNYLQLTYIRRVNSPSVTYHPEFNWALNGGIWTRATASNPETVTPIGSDGVWQRVTVRDLVPSSLANARFGRVVVNASYWTPAQPDTAPDPSPNVP